jgi:subtilisin family serine protease
MIRHAAALCLALAGVLALAPGTSAAAPATSPYVVVLRDGLAAPATVIGDLADSLRFKLRLRYDDALEGFATDLTGAQLAALEAHPAVAFVQPDAVITGAGSVALATGETAPPGVRRVGGVTPAGAHPAASAAVAVLDSGVDLANPDLNARNGTNCISASAPAQDDRGHGTNVAGVIGARNTGFGVTGVAPATTIYAVKILGKNGSGTLSQILCGINWVTANAAGLGIRVANMSVSGMGSDDGNCGNTNMDSWHKALCASTAAGVTWVVSAGNSGADFAHTIPAAYGEVLTVTAMSDTDGIPGGAGPAPSCKKGEADDRYASYSNYAVAPAAAAHAIAAPGTCVVSTKLGGGLSTYYGTSQAAPHAAGAVAVCLGTAAGPGPCAGLTPAGVIQRVRADAVASDTLAGGFIGDPLRPLAGRSFGPLVTAAAY